MTAVKCQSRFPERLMRLLTHFVIYAGKHVGNVEILAGDALFMNM